MCGFSAMAQGGLVLQFSLVADDGGQLYFGATQTTADVIAEVKAFLGRPSADNGGGSTRESTREYFGEAKREDAAVSAPVPLVAGQAYYISAVAVNRQGRDALSIAARGAPFPSDAPIPATFGGVTVLSHYEDGALDACPAAATPQAGLALYDSNKLARLDAVDDFFGHKERKLEFEDLRLKDTEKATADEHDHQVAALVELYTSVDESRLATVDSVLQFSKTIRAPNGITPDVANAESFVTNPEDKFNEQLLRVKGTLDTLQFLAQNFPNPESRRLEEKCRELETDIARHKVQFNYDTEFKAKQCGITRDAWAALMQQQVDMVSEADWRAYRDKKKILPGHFMALDDACKMRAFVGIHDCPYRPSDTIEGGVGSACSKWFDNSGEKQGTRKKPGAEGFHIYIRCALHAQAPLHVARGYLSGRHDSGDAPCSSQVIPHALHGGGVLH
jgi:hypothetical protein